MHHYTDATISEWSEDAGREVADWEDPAECAAHFIALHRLACECPQAFAERLAFLNGDSTPVRSGGKTYIGEPCVRRHAGERYLSNGACVDCSREYKRDERRAGRNIEVPAAVRKARRIERYQSVTY